MHAYQQRQRTGVNGTIACLARARDNNSSSHKVRHILNAFKAHTRRCWGSMFQVCGPATANERTVISRVLINGTTRVSVLEDRLIKISRTTMHSFYISIGAQDRLCLTASSAAHARCGISISCGNNHIQRCIKLRQ